MTTDAQGSLHSVGRGRRQQSSRCSILIGVEKEKKGVAGGKRDKQPEGLGLF